MQTWKAWMLLLALLLHQFFQICVCFQQLLESSTSKIEAIGFLDPQGSVDEHLLVREEEENAEAPAPSEHEEISSSKSGNLTSEPVEVAESLSTALNGNFSSWLSSHRCPSEDFIPCVGEESPDSPCVIDRIQNPCLVAAPRGYMRPVSWPSSILKVRAENVATRSRPATQVMHENKFFLLESSKVQRKYVDELVQIPGLELGSRTRLVLNLEARVGGLSVELGKHGVLTLSIGKKNAKDDVVQLVLERGYPGMVQRFGNKRLPYPNEAFDLVHCGNCTTSWTRRGGLHLAEADRVLQPGGFFVWRNTRRNDKLWADMLSIAVSLCWALSLDKDGLAVWQKPVNNSCYRLQNHRPFCPARSADDADDAWDASLQPCISAPSTMSWMRFTWPSRLVNATHRLRGVLDTPEAYEADLKYWTMLTDFYLTSLGTSRVRDVRNVLDANAGYGGFAAALALKKPALSWWVLNVSPVGNRSDNRLNNVFDRGLLGVYHDWCGKGLSTYPRAFDLVHASRLFSARHRCGALVIMVELDRLLRPGGFAIIRDDFETLVEVQKIASVLEWKSTIQDTDSGPEGRDKVMHCQKIGHFKEN